jgi:hypothetical protein
VPAVVWPDVEAYLIGYLSGALAARPEPYAAGVRVSNEQWAADPNSSEPQTPPARQVIVRDDGGPRLGDVRATARVGFRVLAQSKAECSDLTALVVALVGGIPEATRGETVVAVESLTRGFPVPDDSGTPERYFTAELVVRGTTL